MSNELAHPPHPVVLPAALGWPIHPAMVTVALELPSFRVVRSLVVVRGVSIRGNAGSGADLATLVEPAQTYSQRLATICEQARFQAHLLMLQAAAQVGGSGVIGVCYEYRQNLGNPKGAEPGPRTNRRGTEHGHADLHPAIDL